MIDETDAMLSSRPGWRVTRVDQRIDYPADRRWIATAFYNGYIALSPDIPQPPYARQAEGATQQQARDRVLALCRADRAWLLMWGEDRPAQGDLFG